MARNGHTIHQLAVLAAKTGFDLGFNCAMVVKRYQIERDESVLHFWWFNRALAPSLPRACQEAACIHDKSYIGTRADHWRDWPESIRYEPATVLAEKFTQELLELA